MARRPSAPLPSAPPLSREEEADLAREAAAYRRAGDAEAAAARHWRLALSQCRTAKKEARRWTTPFAPFDDLLSEALHACYTAATKFDPERGLRFNTYARWWIRARIQRHRARAQQGDISLPDSAIETRRQLQGAATYLQQQKRPVTLDNIAEVIGRKLDRASARESLRALREWGGFTTPWEMPADGPDGALSALEDTIADPGEDAEAAAGRAGDLLRLRHALPEVATDPRLWAILAWRMGWGGEVPSLQTIGERLGFSRERARQLEVLGIRWLREIMARLPPTADLGPPPPIPPLPDLATIPPPPPRRPRGAPGVPGVLVPGRGGTFDAFDVFDFFGEE